MVREYLSADCENAVEIFLEIYKNPPFSFSWVDYKNVFNYFEGLAKEANFKGFVYEKDGKAIGFCFGNLINYFPNGKYRISEIFVKRDLQRKGVGSAFIGELEKNLKNISAIEIKTDKRAFSYSFYSKNGFSEAHNIVTMIKLVKM